MSWDPYLDLRSGVFRNLLGIADPTALAQAEAVLTASRIYDLGQISLPGSYDLAHLRAFHRHIFGDLYDWAGELRTVSIGRGGTLFCLPEHIVGDGEELFGWLARTGFLCGADRAVFVDGLTELLADLNALHPFVTATAAPSAPSSPSSRAPPAIPSGGRRWIPRRTSPRPAPRTRATTRACTRCWTSWSGTRLPDGQAGAVATPS